MAIKASRTYSLISALIFTSAVSIVVMSCGGDDDKKADPAAPTTTVKYSEISAFVGTSCAGAGCHSAANPSKGYNMSTRAGIAARASDAVKAIEDGSMPPEKTAFNADTTNKAKLIEWLKAGAPE